MLEDPIVGTDGPDVLDGSDEGETLKGLGYADVLNGQGGDDILMGGQGADQLNGGEGFDTASYAEATSRVIVNLRTASGSLGEADGDSLDSIERLVGSAYNDVLAGSDGADHIEGGAGNDTIYSRLGADVIDGGEGDDIFVLVGGEAVEAVVTDVPGGGTDRVITDAAVFTLTGNIENLQILDSPDTSSLDRLLTLNALANVAVGASSNDIFYAGAGDDDVYGEAGMDTLFGEDGNDRLVGGDGDDVLDGGLGADVLYGDDGFDVVSYTRAASGVTVNLATGRGYTGEAGGDVFHSVEGVIGSAHADALYGTADANHIEGYDGDDVIVGGGGADVIYGGAGNDLYVVGQGALVFDQSGPNGGIDRVVSSATRITLDNATYIENLDIDSSADDGPIYRQIHMNDLANRVVGGGGNDDIYGQGGDDELYGLGGRDLLIGGVGNDRLEGGAGDDRLQGEAGDDRLYGGDGNDSLIDLAGENQLHGGAGNDTVFGGEDRDRLFGEDGNDVLVGGGTGDVLDGGAGDDTLTGGRGLGVNGGADRFVFAGAWGADTITDFQEGRDKLDLSGQGLAYADLTFTAVDADADGAVDDLLIGVDRAGFGTIGLLDHGPSPLATTDFLF